MSKRRPDLEMYAVLDPRIALLKDLRDGESARRGAQWATWQTDRSWPHQSAKRLPIQAVGDDEVRHMRDYFPLVLSATGLLALIVAIAVAFLLPHVG
jgi:hypothetical protein